jgi:hypothetical protein
LSEINPFIHSILQTPQVQRALAAEKDRQLRRANDLAKNDAHPAGQLQHEVESTQAIFPVRDESPKGTPLPRSPKRPPHRTPSPEQVETNDSHIDLKA